MSIERIWGLAICMQVLTQKFADTNNQITAYADSYMHACIIIQLALIYDGYKVLFYHCFYDAAAKTSYNNLTHFQLAIFPYI